MAAGETLEQREQARRLVHGLLLATLVGIPAAGAAYLFELAVEDAQHFLFEGLPGDLGLTGLPGWWVVAVTTAGGALCALALRLPGKGGHPPLAGLSLEGGPAPLLGVLAAAFASLAFGAVLGPEAPLLVLGQWLGLLAARRAHSDVARLAALAGAGAVLAMVLGNPLVSGVLLLEAGRRAPLEVLLSPFLGGAVGYALFTGFGPFDGVPAMSLHVADLPAYTSLRLVDLVLAVPVALAAATVIVACRHLARRVEAAAARVGAPPALVAGGAAVGVVAVLFRALADEPVDLVLFSGAEALSETAAIGAAGVALGVVAAKGVAYAVSLGCGFRGGPIFPALALGIALGAAANALVPDLPLTAAVVAGVAAAGTAQLRLPFTGTLLAVLLAGGSAGGAIAIAVVAAITGHLVRMASDRLEPEPGASPAPAPASPAAA